MSHQAIHRQDSLSENLQAGFISRPDSFQDFLRIQSSLNMSSGNLVDALGTSEHQFFPRVPSLDLLHPFLNQQSPSAPPNPTAPPQFSPPADLKCSGLTEAAGLPSPLPAPCPPPTRVIERGPSEEAARAAASKHAAAARAPSPLLETSPETLAATAQLITAGLTPEAAAAAALQLTAPNPGVPAGRDSLTAALVKPQDPVSKDKTEQRRARRMLSNRESARRSRKRKQEHLTELEIKIEGLEKDRDELAADLQEARSTIAAQKGFIQQLQREAAEAKGEEYIPPVVKEEEADLDPARASARKPAAAPREKPPCSRAAAKRKRGAAC